MVERTFFQDMIEGGVGGNFYWGLKGGSQGKVYSVVSPSDFEDPFHLGIRGQHTSVYIQTYTPQGILEEKSMRKIRRCFTDRRIEDQDAFGVLVRLQEKEA